MLTIGIYPRKSVYRDNSDSVQVQVQLCKDYAAIIYKEQEIEFKIYDKDEGFSGKNTNRPSFQELMADVKAGLLDSVMVYKLDRISRNVQEFSAMYEIFQQHGVSFISVKESFDTTTPMGRTVMYILAAFAQLERENTSERVADNMQALGAAGKWTGGKLPSGMTSVRRQIGDKEHSYLLVDEASIWRPRLLFQLILEGYPITKVERYCRDHGIKTHSGKFLSCSQIYNIITNPVYCQNSIEAYYYFKDCGCSLPDQSLFDGTKGLIGYGKTKTGKASQKKCDKKDWSIAIGIHGPVIPAPDWIAAQKRLGVNKMFHTPKHEIGLLKGVLKCNCGARMDVRTYVKNNIRFSYYYCIHMARMGRQYCNSEYVRIEIIDQLFIDHLQKIKLNPAILKSKRSDNIALQDADSIKSEIKKLQSSIDNLTSALTQAMGTAAAGYIISQISELDSQKKKQEEELRNILLKEAETKSAEEIEQQLYNDICCLIDNFDNIDYAGKNELIRKIVKKCLFDGESLRIIF
ncbi:DNA-invertase hin [Lachnospiraceae bacterium]|nr:DNA-invertase hin [Lachnospiraceae bacterium]